MKEFTIDYSPLMQTLYKKNLKLGDLNKKLGISSATISRINKRQAMNLTTIGSICALLEVEIQDVVRIELS